MGSRVLCFIAAPIFFGRNLFLAVENYFFEMWHELKFFPNIFQIFAKFALMVPSFKLHILASAQFDNLLMINFLKSQIRVARKEVHNACSMFRWLQFFEMVSFFKYHMPETDQK